MATVKEQFLKVFDAEDGACLRVFIRSDKFPEEEMLEIPFANFKAKKEYFEKVLTDNIHFIQYEGMFICGAEYVFMSDEQLMAAEMQVRPDDSVEAYLTQDN